MILHLHSEEEATDLSVWAMDHSGSTIAISDRLQDWLGSISDSMTWPIDVEVPDDLQAALEETIDDWCEVLSAHNEEFHSFTRQT